MRTIALLLVMLGAIAGCGSVPASGPYASPDTSRQADCDRVGGYWNPNAHVCESPLFRW
jgi:predicted small lipoprotein YifL